MAHQPEALHPSTIVFIFNIPFFVDNEKGLTLVRLLTLFGSHRIINKYRAFQHCAIFIRETIFMRQFILASLIVLIVGSLLTAQTTKPQVVKLTVAGMHCDNCVTKVDKALRGVEGVKDVKVDLKSQSAVVTLAAATVKSDALIEAVTDVGFEASIGKAVPSTTKEEKCEGCTENDTQKKGAAKQEDCCKPEETKKKTSTKS